MDGRMVSSAFPVGTEKSCQKTGMRRNRTKRPPPPSAHKSIAEGSGRGRGRSHGVATWIVCHTPSPFRRRACGLESHTNYPSPGWGVPRVGAHANRYPCAWVSALGLAGALCDWLWAAASAPSMHSAFPPPRSARDPWSWRFQRGGGRLGTVVILWTALPKLVGDETRRCRWRKTAAKTGGDRDLSRLAATPPAPQVTALEEWYPRRHKVRFV